MQARYYDPFTGFAASLGRFLSNDPVGFSPDKPGQFNRYAYTWNDPVNKIDPDGNNPVAIGFVVGRVALRAARPAARVAGRAYGSWRASRIQAQGIRALVEKYGSRSAAQQAANRTFTVASNELLVYAGAAAAVATAGIAAIDRLTNGGVPVRDVNKPGFRGEPNTWESGEGQDRYYGADGYPDKDVDKTHDHGEGNPHVHDWDRPGDGSPPTHEDRRRGRAPREDEDIPD